ncbi:MAG: GNAT family N-acetyltransferase [Alphaproteobacteria bacterium]
MEQELITARLRLRRIRRGDAPRVQALCNNWNVARMLSRVPYPNTIEAVETWIGAQDAAWQSGLAYNFVITHSDGPIGVVGVSRRDDGSYEIGYWLGEPWWGQGLMTEAVGRAIDFARAELRLDRLRSDYFADNPASGRIQEKYGFRIIGRGRLNSLSRGGEVDTIFTEIEFSGASQEPEAAS